MSKTSKEDYLTVTYLSLSHVAYDVMPAVLIYSIGDPHWLFYLAWGPLLSGWYYFLYGSYYDQAKQKTVAEPLCGLITSVPHLLFVCVFWLWRTYYVTEVSIA